MLQYFVIIWVIIQFAWILLYIHEMIYGHVKPNKVTRILRAIAPIIWSAAAFSEWITWAILPTFMAGFGPLLVVIASFFIKQSYWKISKLDYLCAILSLIALVGRKITNSALVAIVFAIWSDLLAALPTMRKSRYHADSEGITPYIGGLLWISTSFFAFSHWNMTEILFPVYLILLNLSLISIIIIKKKFIT